MAEKFNVTGEQYFVIDSLLSEIKRLISHKRGCFFRPIWISWTLQDIIENRFVDMDFNKSLVSKKTRYPVTENVFFKIDGQIIELKRQLRCFKKSGSPLNPLLVISALQSLKAGKFSVENHPLLRLLPKKSFYLISSGRRSICEAENVFSFGIDSHFVKNKTANVSAGGDIVFYELNYNAVFKDIFNFFKKDITELYLNENQVVDLCSCHHIYDTEGVFLIPFHSPDGPAVAAVYSGPGDLSIIKYSLNDKTVWQADDHVLVVTQEH